MSGAEGGHAAAKPGQQEGDKDQTEIDRSQREGCALLREKHRVLALPARRSAAAVAVSDSQRTRASLPRISKGQTIARRCGSPANRIIGKGK